MLLYVLNVPLQSSAEDDTAYSPVNDKEKEDPQNGTYIGLTPKADVEAWGWARGLCIEGSGEKYMFLVSDVFYCMLLGLFRER